MWVIESEKEKEKEVSFNGTKKIKRIIFGLCLVLFSILLLLEAFREHC